jgi:hypothetical protein
VKKRRKHYETREEVINGKKYETRKLLKGAAAQGRRGDDRLVHVNAAEERLLKAAGGAGTINPATGLREYGPQQGGYGGGQGGMGGGGGSRGGAGGGKKRDGGALGMGAARDRANERLGGFAGGLSSAGQKSISGGGTGRGGDFVGPGAGVAPFSRTTVTKTKTRPATGSNLARAAVDTILGGLMPGIGIGVGPMVADALGYGYEGPIGTGERTEADSPGRALASTITLAADRKKKSTKPKNPLGSIGTILGMGGGSLRAGGL